MHHMIVSCESIDYIGQQFLGSGQLLQCFLGFHGANLQFRYTAKKHLWTGLAGGARRIRLSPDAPLNFALDKHCKLQYHNYGLQ